MTKEQETLKYLSAMRVIDFNKLGFVYGKESITDTLVLLKDKKIGLEKKDKIIDLMLNMLSFYNNKYGCYIGKNGLVDNCRGMEYCKECLKQYFEKKVEKEL